MGWYYKGDGSPATPTGQDRVDKVVSLRSEALEHFESSETYQRIGYKGHAYSEHKKGRDCQADADRLERDE